MKSSGEYPLILSRKESWGKLEYNMMNQTFNIEKKDGERGSITPYVSNPIVLNIDLTFNCNMNCLHCLAEDMKNHTSDDLNVTNKLIDWINNSPFFLIVITGGEPLLHEKEKILYQLLSQINNKGIIVDTNGTIRPSEKIVNVLRDKKVLIRISQDSVRPQDEVFFRRIGKKQEKNMNIYFEKLKNIEWFKLNGLSIAIQSVLHKRNKISIFNMLEYLVKMSIDKWYIQRFIPSHKAKEEKSLMLEEYEKIFKKLKKMCDKKGIVCFPKRDQRNNCVFLLVGDGEIYTQGEKPGEKIFLGDIRHDLDYFSYVSSPDHSLRYYG